MQIQAINNINFGQIYLAKGDYTDKQKNVINQIKEELRKPSEEYGNKTAEEFYKSEYKMDFFMSDGSGKPDSLAGIPVDYSGYPDSVHLAGVWGLKHIGTGVNEMVQYGDSYGIGIYDEAHPFKTDDIETSHKEHRKNSLGFLTFGAGIVTITILGFLLLFATRKPVQTKELSKPLIENVDSLANKAKEALPDTIKTLNIIK